MPTGFGASVKEEPSKRPSGSPDYNPEAPSTSGVFALMGRPGKGLPLIALAFFWGAHRQQEKPSAWKLL